MKSIYQKKSLRVICTIAVMAVLPCSLAISSSKFEDKTTAECLKVKPVNKTYLIVFFARGLVIEGDMDAAIGFRTPLYR